MARTKAKASKVIKIETAPFDAADYLDDNETITAYLSAALIDPDPDVFLVAVKDAARAHGMSQLAKDTQLGRESLYKALSAGAKPRYDTMIKVINALGCSCRLCLWWWIDLHVRTSGIIKLDKTLHKSG